MLDKGDPPDGWSELPDAVAMCTDKQRQSKEPPTPHGKARR